MNQTQVTAPDPMANIAKMLSVMNVGSQIQDRQATAQKIQNDLARQALVEKYGAHAYQQMDNPNYLLDAMQKNPEMSRVLPDLVKARFTFQKDASDLQKGLNEGMGKGLDLTSNYATQVIERGDFTPQTAANLQFLAKRTGLDRVMIPLANEDLADVGTVRKWVMGNAAILQKHQDAVSQQNANQSGMNFQSEDWKRRQDVAKGWAELERQKQKDAQELRTNLPSYRWADPSKTTQEIIPGSAADQKAQQKNVGQETVSTVAATLRDAYRQLDESGAITNPDNSTVKNLKASLSSSALGQFAGRATGSDAQSIRNQILQSRPILLQAIMKATGMSAKQMDSNVELKLYLQTATDPTLDVRANLRALDTIEKLYGGEAKASSGETKANQTAQKKYATEADVARALMSGEIKTKEDALNIYRTQFGYQ
jgi:hypothetical protein